MIMISHIESTPTSYQGLQKPRRVLNIRHCSSAGAPARGRHAKWSRSCNATDSCVVLYHRRPAVSKSEHHLSLNLDGPCFHGISSARLATRFPAIRGPYESVGPALDNTTIPSQLSGSSLQSSLGCSSHNTVRAAPRFCDIKNRRSERCHSASPR